MCIADAVGQMMQARERTFECIFVVELGGSMHVNGIGHIRIHLE